MADFQIMNTVAGLASALGTIAVYKFNLEQSRKTRAELLEKLDAAMAQSRKHSACELFRMLHGLRMDYEDIEAICQNSKVSKIILALQKAPGMVKHENGRIQYHGLFDSQRVRVSNRYLSRALAGIMGALTIALIVWMSFLSGLDALAALVVVVPVATFFAMQLNSIRQDGMIESLVDENAT